jgi:dedicator of cytokinesis protein 3
MALNSVVDAPTNQGVPMYRRAFLGADFMAVNPEKASIVRRLETAIDELVSRALKTRSGEAMS